MSWYGSLNGSDSWYVQSTSDPKHSSEDHHSLYFSNVQSEDKSNQVFAVVRTPANATKLA